MCHDQNTKPLSFVIVGSGWRSLFYVRIAQKFPNRFNLKYMLCRTCEKAERMTVEYHIPATTFVEVCEQSKPDFVVVAVNKDSLFAETKKWALKGYPVLCETPAAVSVEHLKELWYLVQQGAKIQIAEQYHRYPIMAAGIKAVSEGKLADPYAVYLSLAHDYHGVSLIRRMLRPDEPMHLKLQYMRGERYCFPVTETDSRCGAVTDGSVNEKERTVVTMQFEHNKVAFYDFSGVQYHSFIRSRHVNVQGRDGEWSDTMLRYVDEQHLPVTEQLKVWLDPRYACLETEELCRKSIEWSPIINMDNEQDEYAIATMMFDMGEYIRGGEEVYPVAEALEDAYLFLLIREAVADPGKNILPEKMPWQVL